MRQDHPNPLRRSWPWVPALLCVALAGPATAQTAPPQPAPGDCAPKSQAEAATPPAPGPDGTEPGNASTGWTGGLGGSHTGTNPSGALPGSATWQPPTARGLDLKGAAEPVPPVLC